MKTAEQLNHFLAYYGRRLGLSLGLKNGVCALVRNQHEIAIIELPPNSDCVLFHRQLEALKGVSDSHLRLLLALNFEMDAMRGCWLAMDGEDNLRLCCQQPLATLDAAGFSDTLDAFIRQAEEVGEFLVESRRVA